MILVTVAIMAMMYSVIGKNHALEHPSKRLYTMQLGLLASRSRELWVMIYLVKHADPKSFNHTVFFVL